MPNNGNFDKAPFDSMLLDVVDINVTGFCFVITGISLCSAFICLLLKFNNFVCPVLSVDANCSNVH